MGLVKFGGGIVQISGRVGGDVFARNRSGNYVRAGTKPTNPNTALQQSWRSSVAYLVDAWSQILTATQRTAWNLYGASVPMKNRLGESILLTGFNHYIRSNTILKQQAGTLLAAGPTTFELPEQDPVLAFTLSEASQDLTVVYDDGLEWVDEDDAHMWIFVGKPMLCSRNFFAGPWRFADVVDGDNATPPTSPATVASPFAAAEGQAVWIYARIQRADGRISERFYTGPTLADA